MDNKLSELSKPVATVDVQRGRPDGNMFGVAWSSAGHAMPDGPHFLYSQEYVSALKRESAVNWEAAASLNVENQELKKRIAELEGQLQSGFTPEALAQEERAENAEQRVSELEAKMATPVRLPERYSIDCGVCADPNGDWLNLPDVIATLREQGFTVEGDE